VRERKTRKRKRRKRKSRRGSEKRTFEPTCRLTALCEPPEIPSSESGDLARRSVLESECLIEIHQTNRKMEKGAETKEHDGDNANWQRPPRWFELRDEHGRGIRGGVETAIPREFAHVNVERRRVESLASIGGDQHGDENQHGVEDASQEVASPHESRQRPPPAKVFPLVVHPRGNFCHSRLDVLLEHRTVFVFTRVDHSLGLLVPRGGRIFAHACVSAYLRIRSLFLK
jgi:hypothetical protein